MNTAISIVYKDNDNFSSWPLRVVLEGAITEEQKSIIFANMGSEGFIPSEAGLPDMTPADARDYDNLWNEIDGIELTDDKPNTEMRVEDLVDVFERIGPEGWEEIAERLANSYDDEPREDAFLHEMDCEGEPEFAL